MTRRTKRTSALPVPPSALHKFLWERHLSRECVFNSVELAIELGISALECRQALQAFVDIELMTYVGLDRHGVESWSLSKTGFAVWQNSRVNGRATKDRIQQFEQCLHHVAIAMSQSPSVVSVRVAGASLSGAAYGLFYIGIEVDPVDTSPLAELRLIDTVVQLSIDAEQEEYGLKPDAPCTVVFDARAGTPHRLRAGKVLYERSSKARVFSLDKAPDYCSDKVDALETNWHARLKSYEELLRADDVFHQVVTSAFTDILEGNEPQAPKTTKAFREYRCATGMVNIERERMTWPACCIGTDQNWPADGLSMPPPDDMMLGECRRMFEALGNATSWFDSPAPYDWPIAAAKAEYAFSCGRPKILKAKAVLEECLRRGYSTHSYWMRERPAPKVLQALAIGANEFRTGLKRPVDKTPLGKKETTSNHYVSLFDFGRPQPTCVGVARLTAKSNANYHAAVREYGFHITRLTPGAHALYQEGYLTADPFLTKRLSTPHEVEKFERIASATKKAVNYVLEHQGETIVGHKGYHTSRNSMDINLRSCDPGNLLPSDMTPYIQDVLLRALSKMPTAVARRLSQWWIFPASVPISEVAKACIEEPKTSLLARFANPQDSFVFTRVEAAEGLYKARIEGSDWFLEFTELGSKTPPAVNYGYQGHKSKAKMKCAYDHWNGVLADIYDVICALSILKRLGVAPSLVGIEKSEYPSSDGPLSDFECLLNAIFTGWHSHDEYPRFDSWFEPRFGAGERPRRSGVAKPVKTVLDGSAPEAGSVS